MHSAPPLCAIVQETIVGVNSELYAHFADTPLVVWYADMFGGEYGNRIPAALPSTTTDIAFPEEHYIVHPTPNHGTTIPEPGTVLSVTFGLIFVYALQLVVRQIGRKAR